MRPGTTVGIRELTVKNIIPAGNSIPQLRYAKVGDRANRMTTDAGGISTSSAHLVAMIRLYVPVSKSRQISFYNGLLASIKVIKRRAHLRKEIGMYVLSNQDLRTQSRNVQKSKEFRHD